MSLATFADALKAYEEGKRGVLKVDEGTIQFESSKDSLFITLLFNKKGMGAINNLLMYFSKSSFKTICFIPPIITDPYRVVLIDYNLNEKYPHSPGSNGTGFSPLMYLLMLLFTEKNTIENIAVDQDFILNYIKLHPEEVNQSSKSGWTPLMMAARSSQKIGLKIISGLIEAGANLNSQNDIGWTALFLAIRHALRTSSLETVQFLISAGTDYKLLSVEKESILMIETSLETFQYLLTLDLNLNAVDQNDCTALNFWIKNIQPHSGDVCLELLKRRCRTNTSKLNNSDCLKYVQLYNEFISKTVN